jgi:hypothetical protein
VVFLNREYATVILKNKCLSVLLNRGWNPLLLEKSQNIDDPDMKS